MSTPYFQKKYREARNDLIIYGIITIIELANLSLGIAFWDWQWWMYAIASGMSALFLVLSIRAGRKYQHYRGRGVGEE